MGFGTMRYSFIQIPGMKTLLLFLSMCIGAVATAQAQLEVTLNKAVFMPGDSILFEARYAPWVTSKYNATLNVWMEDVDHKAVWKMRYPMLAGVAAADILLPDGMPANNYALYFSVQDDFFSVKGTVVSPYKDKAIRVTVLLGEEQLLADNISLDEQRSFEMKKMLFADRAKFFFAPVKTNRTNDLQVDLQVTLDSNFQAIDDTLIMIQIGEMTQAKPNSYRFDPEALFANSSGTLKTVEVMGKKKTPAEKFEEGHVSGMFRTTDAYGFDGTESNQFIGWINILEWMKGRVAGLNIQPVGNGFDYKATWQGGETFFFLNEMQVDAQTLTMIPTADIAYVKVFRPPFYGAYLGGAGGAIAVYTKDGSNGFFTGSRNSFLVNGYTPETFRLPVKQVDTKL